MDGAVVLFTRVRRQQHYQADQGGVCVCVCVGGCVGGWVCALVCACAYTHQSAHVRMHLLFVHVLLLRCLCCT